MNFWLKKMIKKSITRQRKKIEKITKKFISKLYIKKNPKSSAFATSFAKVSEVSRKLRWTGKS
jgi:hypothetical protein